jgi:hypothetical protein
MTRNSGASRITFIHQSKGDGALSSEVVRNAVTIEEAIVSDWDSENRFPGEDVEGETPMNECDSHKTVRVV